MSDESDSQLGPEKKGRESERQFSQEQYEMIKRCSENHDMSEWNEWRKRSDEMILLQKGHFGRANLQETDFEGANLQEASFWFADLQEAQLQGANLQEAEFGGAHLRGAKLGEANLRGAKFWEANHQTR